MFLTCSVHSSWQIAWGALSFVVGVMISPVFPPLLFHAFWWLLLGLLGVVLGYLGGTRAALGLIILAGCLVGIWYGSQTTLRLASYQQFIGQEVVVAGRITEDTERGNGGEQRINLGEVKIASLRLPGEVWVSTTSHLDIKRSDLVTIKGTLRKGFGTYPASMSFARVQKVQRPDQADIARDVRDGFADGVRKAINEPAASLGIGYLTGQRSALPYEVDEHLKIVGLTHIVVASGYNLTILVRFARRLFVRISKYASTALALVMITGFVLVTGFSPSMSRAAMVAGLSLATWYYGRGMHPFVLLSLVAAVSVVINPFFAWGDLGWYLSFAAFVGVIVLAPLVHDYFWEKEKPGMIRQVLVDTFCAQIVTMPIIAFAFGTYALYALPANLLILPLIPVTMALTFVAGLAGVFVPAFAELFGAPAEYILRYMIWVARTIAEWPGAQGDIDFGIELLLITYLTITILALYLWRRTKHNFRGDNLIE